MAGTSPNHPTIRRTAVLLSLCAIVTAAVLGLHWFNEMPLAAPLRDAENYVQDQFARHGRLTPADPRLVLIGVDQPSYDDVLFPDDVQGDPVLAALRERWPWSRVVWAALIERLADAGAKTIVIDLVFAAGSEGDAELHGALDKFKDRVVIGSNFSPMETDRGILTRLTTPNAALIPHRPGQPGALDERVGFVNIWPDADGVIRRATFRQTNEQLNDAVEAPPDTLLESLDARALQKFGEAHRLPPGTNPQRIRFTAPPGRGFEMRSVGDVLTPKLWKANYASGEFFRDKLVLIGPMANIFQDFHRTPFAGEMAGPEIHLNILNAALHGEFLHEAPPLGSRCLIALAGLVAFALCQFMRQPVKRLLVIVGLSVGGGFGAYLLFNHANLLLPLVAPLLALNVCGLSALGYDFIVERLERMKLRHTMGLYFSPRVLEAVLADPGSMTPRRADVTMLLTDLRNSTPLAEALGPKGMFDLLNRVFEAQTGAIMSEEGNLEHFLGDQFLSYWGAPQPQPDAADRAQRAAVKLITAMEKLRASLPPDVQTLFGYGVALHSGGVLVGNKGSALRLDYGLVGDAVNEAARIEALTKFYGVKQLVSRETVAQFASQGARRLLDRVVVKGKSEPVELFECENPCTPTNYGELCQRYKAAYDEYHFGHFTAAQAQFEKLAVDFSDGASRTLAARCAQLAAAPPTEWKGVWKMEAK
jgi:adenylate cyclase